MDNQHCEIEIHTLLAEGVFLNFSKKEILQGVTVKSETNSVTGLIGRNGAGKSTLLKVLFGTQKAEESFIFYNGKRIDKPFLKKRLVNYLPQHSFLPKNTTVQQALEQFSVSKEIFEKHFYEIDLKEKIGRLSGGQQRVVETFLVIKTPVLFSLLDEPFTHIMPLHQQTIIDLINEEKKTKGLIITDHLYQNLLPICDNIYLMKDCKSMLVKNIDDLAFHGYISSV